MQFGQSLAREGGLSVRMARMQSAKYCFGAALVLVVITAYSCAIPAPRPQFDVLIRNGRIVDGSGAPWFRGDVGITNGQIVFVGSIGNATASTTIDATNLVVAPGFIDLLGQSEFNV